MRRLIPSRNPVRLRLSVRWVIVLVALTAGLFLVALHREAVSPANVGRLRTIATLADRRVHYAAFSGDGKSLFVSGIEMPLEIRDPLSLRLMESIGQDHLDKRFNSETEFAWNYEGSKVAYKNFKPSGIFLYDRTKREEIFIGLADPRRYFITFDLSPDGSLLATCGQDIRLWDATDGSLLLTCELDPGDTAYNPLFSPDGKWLTTQSFASKYRIWDVLSRKLVQVIESGKTDYDFKSGEEQESDYFRYSPNSQWLAMSIPGHTNIYCISDGTLTGSFDCNDPFQPAIAFHPHLPILAVGTHEGNLSLRSVPDGRLLGKCERPDVMRGAPYSAKGQDDRQVPLRYPGVDQILWSPDGALLVTGGEAPGGGRRIVFRDPRNLTPLHEFRGKDLYDSGLEFSPDGRTLLVPIPGERVEIMGIKNSLTPWLNRFKR